MVYMKYKIGDYVEIKHNVNYSSNYYCKIIKLSKYCINVNFLKIENNDKRLQTFNGHEFSKRLVVRKLTRKESVALMI